MGAPSSILSAWNKEIAEVQTTLAWARRTNRWGKEMPHIPVLAEAICKGDLLEAGQRAILITFLVQDHIYFLLKMGILKFANYTPVQWHRRNLRFITLSHVFNFALCARAIQRIRERQANKPKVINYEKTTALQENSQGDAAAEKEIRENKLMTRRYVLTFFQMLHV